MSWLQGETQAPVFLCRQFITGPDQVLWQFWLRFPKIMSKEMKRPCRLVSYSERPLGTDSCGRQARLAASLPLRQTALLHGASERSRDSLPLPHTLLLGCTLESFPPFLGPFPS